ncbi:MAG: hypothetical protein ACI8PZ_001854 [Myxococcota bacterium]|jgi:hypothetical protein
MVLLLSWLAACTPAPTASTTHYTWSEDPFDGRVFESESNSWTINAYDDAGRQITQTRPDADLDEEWDDHMYIFTWDCP